MFDYYAVAFFRVSTIVRDIPFICREPCHDRDGVCALIIFVTAEWFAADVYGRTFFCCRSGFQQQEMAVPRCLFRSSLFSSIMMHNASLIQGCSHFDLACSITDV